MSEKSENKGSVEDLDTKKDEKTVPLEQAMQNNEMNASVTNLINRMNKAKSNTAQTEAGQAAQQQEDQDLEKPQHSK